jgi:dynein heavy chain
MTAESEIKRAEVSKQ